jgi:hypothetical protein
MNDAGTGRVSLLLPIASRRAILAATQVVFAFLREGRVELDLLRGHPDPPRAAELNVRAPGAVLFIATRARDSTASPESLAALENAVRSAVERAYRRQGIESVEYDLQML